MILDFEERVPDAKPCPFCGCRTIKAETKKWVEEHRVRGVRISCDGCMASVFHYSDDHDYEVSYGKALEKWNRRAE